MSENRAKIYIIEIKIVSLIFTGQGHGKKRGLKNEADIL